MLKKCEEFVEVGYQKMRHEIKWNELVEKAAKDKSSMEDERTRTSAI